MVDVLIGQLCLQRIVIAAAEETRQFVDKSVRAAAAGELVLLSM